MYLFFSLFLFKSEIKMLDFFCLTILHLLEAWKLLELLCFSVPLIKTWRRRFRWVTCIVLTDLLQKEVDSPVDSSNHLSMLRGDEQLPFKGIDLVHWLPSALLKKICLHYGLPYYYSIIQENFFATSCAESVTNKSDLKALWASS